jgi:TrmH family RNA methyltransferase
MITSLRNDKVRLVRSLQERRRTREREGSFVAEGLRLNSEVIQSGITPEFIFYTSSAAEDPRIAALLAHWTEAGVDVFEVDEPVLEACSDTETPQGVLAVVPIPRLSPPPSPDLTLVLDRLRDPGNLGTILRTALATGVDQVLLAPGTVDFTNPKVVRAGAGAHVRLPVEGLGWQEIAERIGGCRVYLAAAGGEQVYTQVDWREPAALVIGGEAAGAGKRAWDLAEVGVSIPMAPGVESLNAAIAAAVILFEAVRQRRERKVERRKSGNGG